MQISKPYKFLLIGIILMSVVEVRAKCPGEWLGDMLKFENPRVIKQLIEIERKGKGYKVPGISLCDGSIILDGWVFLQAIHIPKQSQHIYIFEEDSTLRAVAWVELDGKPLKIPPRPKGELCREMNEEASVVSGDVYTWVEVQPGHGVVLLFYPTREWIRDLTN